MTSTNQPHGNSGRREVQWSIRAIPNDPIDPRTLARLFIQMALERADADQAAKASRTDTETVQARSRQ